MCYCVGKQLLNNLSAVGKKSGEKIFVKDKVKEALVINLVIANFCFADDDYKMFKDF